LDILFPAEDGWQILQHLKTDPDTRDIPVLIVSIVDDRPRGLHMGAADYLVKPVTKEALLAGLARLRTPPPRLQGMQVLAIDDDPQVLELLRASLEGDGISLLTATDGPEGLRIAQAKRPDLIILDLMMPGMTGFEVVHHLRTDPATSEIPIFICSAKTLTREERELLAQQVERIIQKGDLLPQDLLQMIAAVGERQGRTLQSR
jgi:CheY-like chemotaxis protein